MTTTRALDRGRSAYAAGAWANAYTQLSVAAVEAPLALDDLEHLAISAHLTGRAEEATDLLARAHQVALRDGDVARAAYDAFWLGFDLIHRGESARGGGWLARATSLVEDPPLDCPARGYVLVPGAIRALDEGDATGALDSFERAGEIAARFHDPDLATLSRLGRGSALIAVGEHDRGVALLDEAMVAVTTGEVSATVAGIVYCATIEACQQLFDLRRAQEWTAALTHWCESQPDLVPFRGRCLVYRAELLQLHGAWGDADAETQQAVIRLLTPPPEPAVGAAYYQRAELHRLRGDVAQAEADYREGAQWGRSPEPGLALLRSATGAVADAMTMIRQALADAIDPSVRTRLLGPAVEISLEGVDVAGARLAADELARAAHDHRAPLLQATAAQALGSVQLAEGAPHAALATLRRALAAWHGLEAPYEVARTQFLIGVASESLGDVSSAGFAFEAARRAFADLGATPDVARVDARMAATSTATAATAAAGPLTGREVEVIRLLAAGNTNRAIAAELGISEKTVARHLSNIYTKLDLSTRSAATAYAYEHGLQASTTNRSPASNDP